MVRLILGSQSPRRKEILGCFTLPFEQVAPPYDEEALAFSGDPVEYASTLSKGKACSLLDAFPEDIILTADTVVFRNGKSYGKPRNVEEAFQMFSELVGEWHSVYTAVTVRKGKNEYCQAEETKVKFNQLNSEQIRHYILRSNWMDKAAGYSIQQVGGLIIDRIEGCYYNVMGLPVNTVHTLLKNVNIDLWNYI